MNRAWETKPLKFISSESRRKEKQHRLKSILRDNGENVSNLVNDINLQIQEGEQTSSRINPKKSTPRHIIDWKLKTEKKISKTSKRKDTLPIGTMGFFSETTVVRGSGTFSSAERKNG